MRRREWAISGATVGGVLGNLLQNAAKLTPAGGRVALGVEVVERTLHGGEVRARSDGPGRGAEFEGTLPAGAHRGARRRRGRGQPAGPSDPAGPPRTRRGR